MIVFCAFLPRRKRIRLPEFDLPKISNEIRILCGDECPEGFTRVSYFVDEQVNFWRALGEKFSWEPTRLFGEILAHCKTSMPEGYAALIGLEEAVQVNWGCGPTIASPYLVIHSCGTLYPFCWEEERGKRRGLFFEHERLNDSEQKRAEERKRAEQELYAIVQERNFAVSHGTKRWRGPQKQECVVCLDKVANCYLFCPWTVGNEMHVCVCSECAERLKTTSRKCPQCQFEFSQTLEIAFWHD
jgi:hypothetical protein